MGGGELTQAAIRELVVGGGVGVVTAPESRARFSSELRSALSMSLPAPPLRIQLMALRRAELT